MAPRVERVRRSPVRYARELERSAHATARACGRATAPKPASPEGERDRGGPVLARPRLCALDPDRSADRLDRLRPCERETRPGPTVRLAQHTKLPELDDPQLLI